MKLIQLYFSRESYVIYSMQQPCIFTDVWGHQPTKLKSPITQNAFSFFNSRHPRPHAWANEIHFPIIAVALFLYSVNALLRFKNIHIRSHIRESGMIGEAFQKSSHSVVWIFEWTHINIKIEQMHDMQCNTSSKGTYPLFLYGWEFQIVFNCRRWKRLDTWQYLRCASTNLYSLQAKKSRIWSILVENSLEML